MSMLYRERVGAAVITRVLSRCNDQIVQRTLELTAFKFRLPPTKLCWLGLGSEGRLEQTLATDQDNALLFVASDAAEARQLREHLLPYAQAVNSALADCGFPLCNGGVMAGNPAWCLSLGEWRDCFSRWIRTPEPEALLNASIFFDFRCIWGSAQLARVLREHLRTLAGSNDIFLRMMATNALAAEPPLGRLRGFITDADAGDTLDLKKFGSRIFVDAARILALAYGIDEPATVQRLLGVAAAGGLVSGEAEGLVRAFLALQDLRLASQIRSVIDFNVCPSDNRIAPAQLNDFDRAGLLEALNQARALQRRLKIRFHIEC
jgi:CBS domain-containing protein